MGVESATYPTLPQQDPKIWASNAAAAILAIAQGFEHFVLSNPYWGEPGRQRYLVNIPGSTTDQGSYFTPNHSFPSESHRNRLGALLSSSSPRDLPSRYRPSFCLKAITQFPSGGFTFVKNVSLLPLRVISARHFPGHPLTTPCHFFAASGHCRSSTPLLLVCCVASFSYSTGMLGIGN